MAAHLITKTDNLLRVSSLGNMGRLLLRPEEGVVLKSVCLVRLHKVNEDTGTTIKTSLESRAASLKLYTSAVVAGLILPMWLYGNL